MQALYIARVRASRVEEGLPGVGGGWHTPFPVTSAHEGAMAGGEMELDLPSTPASPLVEITP